MSTPDATPLNERELKRAEVIQPDELMHEMRSAVSQLFSFSNLMREGGFNYSQERDMIDTLCVVSKSLMTLVEYYSSRINNPDPSKPIFSDFNVHMLVMGAVNLVRGDKEIMREVKINFKIEPKFTSFISDENLVHGILKNLLINAVKFSRDNGEVIVNVIKTETSVFITVQDHGCGIDPKILPIIFEPYVFSSSTRFRGMGLGLAYVKKNVELLGGRVTVESELHKGSTFTVQLPLYPNILS